MADYFASLENAVVDRSPDELIGAIVIALALSLALAGIYFIGRRNARETLMPMIALMIVANLASMAVGAGYLLHTQKSLGFVTGDRGFGTTPGPDPILVETIFRAADKNRDGLLTGEEASVAAAEFVRRIDASGTGSIDAHALEIAIPAVAHRGRNPADRPFPPPYGPSPPPPGPFHRHPGQPGIGPPPRWGQPAAHEEESPLPSPDDTQPLNDPGSKPGP